MMKEKEKIAVLPRGLEGLCISAPEKDLYYFVGAGTKEEAWVRGFLSPERIVAYSLPKGSVFEDTSTEDIIRRTNFSSLMKKLGIRAFLVTPKQTAFIDAWAKRQGVRVISTAYAQQRYFEDKITFDTFLEEHHLPKPKSVILSAKEMIEADELPFSQGVVIQQKDSSGGEGTFFARSVNDLHTIARKALRKDEACLVRAYVEGRTYGITVFVSPGSIVLSGLRLQCFYPNVSHGHALFSGIQWIPSKSISHGMRQKIDACFSHLGKLLHGVGFFGFANMDFLISGGNIHIIECNPRFSSATAQVSLAPETVSNEPVGRRFLSDKGSYGKTPQVVPFPDSDYVGAVCNVIVSEKALERRFRMHATLPIGTYRPRRGAFMFVDHALPRRDDGTRDVFFYSEVERGEGFKGKDSPWTLLSHAPLFTRNGLPTVSATRIMSIIRETYMQRGDGGDKKDRH